MSGHGAICVDGRRLASEAIYLRVVRIVIRQSPTPIVSGGIVAITFLNRRAVLRSARSPAQHFLRTAWPWSFIACLIAWLYLFSGINLIGYFFGVNNPNLAVILILLPFDRSY